MSLNLMAVSFDVHDPATTSRFWSGLLNREQIVRTGDVLLPGSETQVGLRFVEAASRQAGQRLHLHVTSSTAEEQERLVQSVLRLGGSRRGGGPLPIGRDIYLNDPDGYDFCAIEPGNAYLADCGPLGEVTCDGTRRVGLFWHEALEWPLVWDEGDQTAIQSPHGGTKIAWDAGAHETEESRQRFELTAVDLAAETSRLISLGATLISNDTGTVVLADPDGVRFTLSNA